MRCDQFLPSLESGHRLRRAAARRHAEQCASCRAAAAMLDQVKAELTAAEPLPPALRQDALSIADERSEVLTLRSEALPTSSSASTRSLCLAALAASIFAAAVAWIVWQGRRSDEMAEPRDPRPALEQLGENGRDVRHIGPITIVTIEPSQELDALAGEVAKLTVTLRQATAEAERLAVQQALERVLTDYQGTFAGSP